jgi:hypothetical protein
VAEAVRVGALAINGGLACVIATTRTFKTPVGKDCKDVYDIGFTVAVSITSRVYAERGQLNQQVFNAYSPVTIEVGGVAASLEVAANLRYDREQFSNAGYGQGLLTNVGGNQGHL